MTENNRFEIGMLKNYVNDNKTNYCYVLEVTSDAKHLCNLLNQLNNKNEQLKSTINTLTHDNTKMKKVLNTTKKENEYIKNTIQEAIHNERTAIGKSVLKQLLEQIS